MESTNHLSKYLRAIAFVLNSYRFLPAVFNWIVQCNKHLHSIYIVLEIMNIIEMIKPHRRVYIEYKRTPVILCDTWISTGFGVCGNSGTNFIVQRATKGYLSIIIEQTWRNLLEELAHVTTEANKLQTGCLRTRAVWDWRARKFQEPAGQAESRSDFSGQ